MISKSGRGITFLLACACTVASLASCNDWLNNDTTTYYSRYAVVSKDDAKISFLTDGGLTLHTVSRSAAVTSLVDHQRVIVDFTVKEELQENEYSIDLYNIYRVLTKDALLLTPRVSDSLGTDPVAINSAWIRHGYLNVDFSFRGGEPGLKHMVNLAVDTVNRPSDADYLVEFRHNAFKDPYTRVNTGVVAFPLESLLDHVRLPEQTPDEITIRLKFKYHGANGSEHFLPIDWKLVLGETVSTGDNEEPAAADDHRTNAPLLE
jgi:hypothetical protein